MKAVTEQKLIPWIHCNGTLMPLPRPLRVTVLYPGNLQDEVSLLRMRKWRTSSNISS